MKKKFIFFIVVGILISHFYLFFSVVIPLGRAVIKSSPKARHHFLSKKQFKRFYLFSSFINKKTPPNSVIRFPLKGRGRAAKANGVLGFKISHYDYFIFPRRPVRRFNAGLGKYYKYIVRSNVRGPKKPEFLEKHAFNDEYSIELLKKPHVIQKYAASDFLNIKATFLNVMMAFLKIILFCLSGIYWVRRFFSERTLPGFLVTSFLVGIVINTIIYVGLNFFNIYLTERIQFIYLFLMALPSVLSLHKKPFVIKRYWKIRPQEAICFLLIALFFSILFIKSVYSPIIRADAVNIWAIKARAIFTFKSLENIGTWGNHVDYPPLLPIVISQLAIAGERMVKFLFPLFALCLWGLIYEAIASTNYSRWLKLVLPLLIFSSSIFINHSHVVFSNLLFTLFITKAVMVLSQFRKNYFKKGAIALTLILFGVVLTRSSGDAYYICIVFIAMAFAFPAKLNYRFFYLLIPLFVTILWKIYLLVYAKIDISNFFMVENNRNSFLDVDFNNIYIITKYIARYALNMHFGGVTFISFIIVAFLRFRKIIASHITEFAFLFLGMIALFLFSIYIAPILGVERFFIHGFSRYYMIFMPIGFIILLREIDVLLYEK